MGTEAKMRQVWCIRGDEAAKKATGQLFMRTPKAFNCTAS